METPGIFLEVRIWINSLLGTRQGLNGLKKINITKNNPSSEIPSSECLSYSHEIPTQLKWL